MSPIMYSHATGDFVVVPDVHCGQPVSDTGCDAPTCSGLRCEVCGSGCDRDVPGGVCLELEELESDVQRAERIRAERAAWGLRDLG